MIESTELSVSVSASRSTPSELDIAEILAPSSKSDGGIADILDVDYILDAVEQRERMMERLILNLGPSLETISLGGNELSILDLSRHSTISLSRSALDDEHGILDNMTIEELIAGVDPEGFDTKISTIAGSTAKQ